MYLILEKIWKTELSRGFVYRDGKISLTGDEVVMIREIKIILNERMMCH
jgi:hypothetical protein